MYGRNWGSDKAVELAQRLYQHVIRTEIINGKIHVLAEGMGSLVAMKLLEKMEGNLRSIAFINPILSLTRHINHEKENKFFYKRLIKELELAFHKDQHQIENEISSTDPIFSMTSDLPIKIIHVMSQGRSLDQYHQLGKNKNKSLDISYILPEKKNQIGEIIIKFYQHNESFL